MKKNSRAAIQIVEVGLRDGLQNETSIVSVANRVALAQRLCEAGLGRLELGAFVRPDRVPQMAGSAEVIRTVLKKVEKGELSSRVRFSALVPNSHGFDDAKATGIQEIAIFGATS